MEILTKKLSALLHHLAASLQWKQSSNEVNSEHRLLLFHVLVPFLPVFITDHFPFKQNNFIPRIFYVLLCVSLKQVHKCFLSAFRTLYCLCCVSGTWDAPTHIQHNFFWRTNKQENIPGCTCVALHQTTKKRVLFVPIFFTFAKENVFYIESCHTHLSFLTGAHVLCVWPKIVFEPKRLFFAPLKSTWQDCARFTQSGTNISFHLKSWWFDLMIFVHFFRMHQKLSSICVHLQRMFCHNVFSPCDVCKNESMWSRRPTGIFLGGFEHLVVLENIAAPIVPAPMIQYSGPSVPLLLGQFCPSV